MRGEGDADGRMEGGGIEKKKALVFLLALLISQGRFLVRGKERKEEVERGLIGPPFHWKHNAADKVCTHIKKEAFSSTTAVHHF